MADVYSERPNLYIGFYGCDKVRGMDLLEKPNKVLVSTHDYEWLGHGFYIWENNMDRALDWAREHHPRFNDGSKAESESIFTDFGTNKERLLKSLSVLNGIHHDLAVIF